jgi:hypothetical protein
MAALQAVPVEPVRLREREVKREKKSISLCVRRTRGELDALLKIRTGKDRKVE